MTITLEERTKLREKYPRNKVINKLLDELDIAQFDLAIATETMKQINTFVDWSKLENLMKWARELERIQDEMKKPGARRWIEQIDDKLFLHVATPKE